MKKIRLYVVQKMADKDIWVDEAYRKTKERAIESMKNIAEDAYEHFAYCREHPDTMRIIEADMLYIRGRYIGRENEKVVVNKWRYQK